MDIKSINDSVFEGLFKQAVIDSFLEELDSLPPDEELAKIYVYSPEHEAGMKKLFAREARKERIRKTARRAGKMAAVLAIAVTILFGILMSVPQVRATVIDTIVEWYDKFTKFTSPAPETIKPNLEPRYIPGGFKEVFRDEVAMSTDIIYENDAGIILVFQYSDARNSVSVDNENNHYEILLIDGIEYHIFETIVDRGENTIVWELYGQRNTIFSIISIDELLAVATSIEKIK